MIHINIVNVLCYKYNYILITQTYINMKRILSTRMLTKYWHTKFGKNSVNKNVYQNIDNNLLTRILSQRNVLLTDSVVPTDFVVQTDSVVRKIGGTESCRRFRWNWRIRKRFRWEENSRKESDSVVLTDSQRILLY